MVLSALIGIGYLIRVEVGDVAITEDFHPPFLRIFTGLFLIFSVAAFTAAAAMWYYFPEIRPRNRRARLKPHATPLEVVLFVSTEEEAKVIEAVKTLSNRAYQFEIARYTGLSRMKVHRIIKRLADRDIVSVTEEGRNRLISLSDWLVG